MAVRTSEEFKKVHIQSEEFNGLVGTFASDLIQKKVGGRKGEFLGELTSKLLSSPSHKSSSKSAELASLLTGLLHKQPSSRDKNSQDRDGMNTSYPANPSTNYSNATYPSPYNQTGYPSQNYGDYSNVGGPQAGSYPGSASSIYHCSSNADYGLPRPIGFIMPSNQGDSYPAPQQNYGGANPSAYSSASSPYSSPQNNNPYNPNLGPSASSPRAPSAYNSSPLSGNYVYEGGISQQRNQEEQGRFASIGGRIEGIMDRFAKSSIKEGGSFNLKGGKEDGGSNIEHLIGSLIGGGGDRGKYYGGGSNIKPDTFKGGMVEIVGNLIGEAAHRFLGVNPTTGKIIGSIAGNVLFNMGGKDNTLGNIGKVVLDNIVSGKFHRKVDPYVKPQPTPTPGEPARVGHAQHFYSERDRCLRERRLFEDPEFPANNNSLYYSKRPPAGIEWRRPGQIIHDPQLIAEGHSRFDVIQGELGNCWFMAAAANLTLRDELFYRVVPPDQSFTDNYAGIFHFQFWQYGHWVDVVIDDRLPTYNGKLVFMHSRENNEFWSALLEKAYAKLNGSYEALRGGTTSEALEDMTGGLTEFYDLKNPPANFLQMMMKGFEMGSLFACSIEADPVVWEARLRNGLVKGHAYSISAIRLLNTPRNKVVLLRIRNPWGNSQEWNGAWSDHSSEWNSISTHEKREMGLHFAHDGEFWMSFQDFMRNFEKMEICNLGPDVMNEIAEMTGIARLTAIQHIWSVNSFHGSWRRSTTAGGCRNYLRSFASNPQYRIRLTDADPYDDDRLCTVIIAVMQKYRRELKHTGLDTLAIGFSVYETSGYRGRLDTKFITDSVSCARSPAFINLREVTGRFRVPPGEYVIIPSTYEPNEEGEFMLRIFTNGLISSQAI